MKKTNKNNEDFYEAPEIDLLNKRQWSYVQRKYELSSRELEVAELICKGLSNKEIAKKLNIAGGTVKTYVRNIYRRVRVRNKIQMLLRFVEDLEFVKK